MKRKIFTGLGFVAFILCLALLAFFISRYQGEEDMAVFLLQDTGMEISHLTSGLIRADTLIAVRFREAQVRPELVGRELPSTIFTFTPEIGGKAYWEDEQTLVFAPAVPLYQKMNYHGVLDLAGLFPERETGGLEKLEFHFETAGQQLVDMKGDFLLVEEKDPENVYFLGRISLSERVSRDKLQEALQIEMEGRKLSFTVETDDNLHFKIKTEDIRRYRLQERELRLKLRGGEVGLGGDMEEKISLAAIESPLALVRIEEEKNGEFSRIRLVFSDKLREDRDYQGYLNITPAIDYRVTVDNNSLLITGKFRPREKYNIQLFPGIESVFGQRLAEGLEEQLEIEISDLNPAVEFVNSGFFLTSASDRKISFRTLNVERLRLQVKKVREENLIQFFEENPYRPAPYAAYDFDRYQFRRYGEIIEDRILEIGRERNKWIQSELDLSNVLTEEESALYIVQLEFDETQALYFSEDLAGWYRSDYLERYGRAVKYILLSDIGITARELGDKLYVFLTDLLSTEPLDNAIVELKDAEGRLLDRGYSSDDGLAVLRTANTARYLEVRRGNKYAIMNLTSSVINNSVFDIGGIQAQDGVNAFIYTERGVYRPGDEINVSAIVRNEDDTFPTGHPVTFKLFNPRGILFAEKVETRGEDGFYTFNFKTGKEALTGTWQGVLEIGSRRFTHEIRIEEVVPYRIRVNIDSEKEVLAKEDKSVNFSISSEYLFGSPASGLESETVVSVEPYEISFPGYSNFVFTDESMDFSRLESNTFREKLDEEGRVRLSWDIPRPGNVPSALRLLIDTKVYESGGRAVPARKTIPMEHYESYVGIMKLENPEPGMGEQVRFNIVNLSKDGEPIANKELGYRIYHLRRYWWWEFSNQNDFRRHYKSNEQTELVEEGTIRTNSEGFASLEYRLDDYGEILLEVRDPESGHQAGYFFRSYYWGDSAQDRSADVVNLKLDKKEYLPGEKAVVSLNTPARGRALVLVEKGEEVLYRAWKEIEGTETSFELEVKEEYIPNAYISVIVYQPYGELENDLPLRIYGIIPLHVKSEGTRLEFDLDLPAEIRPEEELTVRIQTRDKRQARFTIAVVDEGLLDITGFRTPDPWNYFYSKQRLLSRNYDNFADIIDLAHGYIYHRFSVGGGMDEEDREQSYHRQQALSGDAERFKPVSLFEGPLQTDEKGYAEVTFQIPNYTGSLRVMVVAAEGGNYGSGEARVAVKAPLMVLPTLPRVLGPLDRIRIPVTVFALEDNPGEVKVKLEVEGPARITGESEKTIRFNGERERELYFELAAENMVGKLDLRFYATAEETGYTAREETELAVRPYNPYIYSSMEEIVDAGGEAVFTVPAVGVAGTARARLSVSSVRGLNINHRLNWLLRYPYGCAEQVTSIVFPQLYLPELYKLTAEELKEIDENINGGIASYREYQLRNGGFSYWPGENIANQWATNYVGHFLLEARRKGYHVPEDIFNNWLKYQLETARGNQGDLLTRAYRLYLLALAGNPLLSAMNYMRESELGYMNNPEKYYLAAAYQLAGYEEVAAEILAGAGLEVADYLEFSGTFGSTLRDKAIILDIMTVLGEYGEALKLYNEIAEEISSDKWLSTQATAYSLMAMSKYLREVVSRQEQLSGELILADGSALQVEIEDLVEIISLEDSFGEQISFRNGSEIPLYVSLEWEGIPEREDLAPVQSNLTLQTAYYDQDGNRIEVDQVKQGESFYILYRVGQKGNQDISEVALVQVLPAGWEIHNIRLLGGELPEWTGHYNLNQEKYLDIRDDRIMWFFDMMGYVHSYDFIVMINPVTVGEFYLPPTLVEAMYNNDYRVVTEGRKVEVLPR